MYAGTTLHGKSGGIIGVHQRIDRIARRDLKRLPGVGSGFPRITEILHFEGNNGPDGIKRKSPSVDEPWHYIDPENPDDTALLDMIRDHHANLVEALRSHNDVRAAFEAAWVAHAITDGLTPAHHYPLADKIEELWGKPKESRISIKEKNFIKGKNRRETLRKNWEYWGAKGVFITHGLFEFGVATSIKTTKFSDSLCDKAWLKDADQKGLDAVFLETMQRVHGLAMYETFWKKGWNTRLARQTRQILIPEICRVVIYAWYSAYQEAQR